MASPPPPAFDVNAAIAAITSVIATVANAPAISSPTLAGMTAGKLYEFHVLGQLLRELAARGWSANFVGTTLILKASPGIIKNGDPHFVLTHPRHGQAELRTDIQVTTLGSEIAPVSDNSGYHEIDIVVVPAGTMGMPRPDQLLLGIECKAVAKFKKQIVREVLGRRRELSFLCELLPCALDGSNLLPCWPTSEYWLAFVDPAGLNYRQSPEVFGIEFKHWSP